MNLTKAQLGWICGHDTGTSSKTIFSVMTGVEAIRADVPYDPGDFGRCYRLLDLVPEWRPRLQEVADRYAEWGPLVKAWSMLEEEYECAIDPREQGKQRTAAFSAMYQHMQILIDEGRLAAGWTNTSPGCWRGPANQMTVEIRKP